MQMQETVPGSGRHPSPPVRAHNTSDALYGQVIRIFMIICLNLMPETPSVSMFLPSPSNLVLSEDVLGVVNSISRAANWSKSNPLNKHVLFLH